MFRIGELISYRSTGVCRVEDIREESLTGEKKTYYILKPIIRNSSTIYVPLDNEVLCGRMAPMMSKADAKELLKNSHRNIVAWVEDAKARQVAFNEIIVSGKQAQVAGVVRALAHHKKAVAAAGRKFYASDERLLASATKTVVGELAYVLEQGEEDIVTALTEE